MLTILFQNFLMRFITKEEIAMNDNVIYDPETFKNLVSGLRRSNNIYVFDSTLTIILNKADELIENSVDGIHDMTNFQMMILFEILVDFCNKRGIVINRLS